MNPQSLHDTARRYLERRYGELSDLYAQLPGQGRAADGYHYTDEAQSIFPRYNVVNAILVEIERLDGDDLPDVAELADKLMHAAGEAQSPVHTVRWRDGDSRHGGGARPLRISGPRLAGDAGPSS